MPRETEKILLIAAIIVIVIIAIGGVFSIFMMDGYGSGCMVGSGMMGYGGMGFGWLMLWPTIFIIILIIGIYFVTTGFRREEKPSQSFTDPIDLLKKRYAKGEITSEEFKKMKKNLTD